MAPLRLCVSWTEKGRVNPCMAHELLTRSYQDKGVEKSMLAGSHHGKHGVSMGFKRGLNQGNQGRHNVVNRRNPQSHYLETSNLSKNSLLGLLGCFCMSCVQLSHTVGFPWISMDFEKADSGGKTMQGVARQSFCTEVFLTCRSWQTLILHPLLPLHIRTWPAHATYEWHTGARCGAVQRPQSFFGELLFTHIQNLQPGNAFRNHSDILYIHIYIYYETLLFYMFYILLFEMSGMWGLILQLHAHHGPGISLGQRVAWCIHSLDQARGGMPKGGTLPSAHCQTHTEKKPWKPWKVWPFMMIEDAWCKLMMYGFTVRIWCIFFLSEQQRCTVVPGPAELPTLQRFAQHGAMLLQRADATIQRPTGLKRSIIGPWMVEWCRMM